jgi:hypothetical protein
MTNDLKECDECISDTDTVCQESKFWTGKQILCFEVALVLRSPKVFNGGWHRREWMLGRKLAGRTSVSNIGNGGTCYYKPRSTLHPSLVVAF